MDCFRAWPGRCLPARANQGVPVRPAPGIGRPLVLLLLPPDVLVKSAFARAGGRRCALSGVVQCHELVQQDAQRPPVEHQVVNGNDHGGARRLAAVVLRSRQLHAKEGRARNVHPSRAVLRQEGVHVVPPPDARNVRHRYPHGLDHLGRRIVLYVKFRSKYVVPVQQELKRAVQSVNVHRSLKGVQHLLEVHVFGGGRDHLKVHSFLRNAHGKLPGRRRARTFAVLPWGRREGGRHGIVLCHSLHDGRHLLQR